MLAGKRDIFGEVCQRNGSMPGVPDGAGLVPNCAHPHGFCNLKGRLVHSNSQAESWSTWRREAGLQPILPIRASLAILTASSMANTCTWLDLGLPPPSRLVTAKLALGSRDLAAMDAPPIADALGTERSSAVHVLPPECVAAPAF